MNHNNIIPEPFVFDLGRLTEYVREWQNPQSEFSRPFLATYILESTERLHRHLQTPTAPADQIQAAKSCQAQAENLIKTDPEIAEHGFTLTLEYFRNNLTQLRTLHDAGMPPEELDHYILDCIDQYFGLECITGSLERLLANDPRLDNLLFDMTDARQDMIDTILVRPAIADQLVAYAEFSPGGPNMFPWPAILEHAPNPLFDAALSHVINTPVGAELIVFPCRNEKALMRAESDGDLLNNVESLKLIFQQSGIEAGIYQSGDEVFLIITSRVLPEDPNVTLRMGSDKVTLSPIFPIDASGFRFLMGSIQELTGKTVILSMEDVIPEISIRFDVEE